MQDGKDSYFETNPDSLNRKVFLPSDHNYTVSA